MARRRVVGLLRPEHSARTVREQLAEAPPLSAGIRARREHLPREPHADDALRELAWSIRGTGRAPRWRV